MNRGVEIKKEMTKKTDKKKNDLTLGIILKEVEKEKNSWR